MTMEEKPKRGSRKKTILELPLLPMHGGVLFPNMKVHFDLDEPYARAAVEEALSSGMQIFIDCFFDGDPEEFVREDLERVGVIAEIKQMISKPDDKSMRVFIEARERAELRELYDVGSHYTCKVKRLPYAEKEDVKDTDMEALLNVLKRSFAEHLKYNDKLPKDKILEILTESDPMMLCEKILFLVILNPVDRQEILDENSLYQRLLVMARTLSYENEIAKAEHEIHERTQASIDQDQRQFFLREQMRIIAEELGEERSFDGRNEFIQKILDLHLSDIVTKKLCKEARRLDGLPRSSQEAYGIITYLEACLELPWNIYIEENLDLARVNRLLDEDHYGMRRIKDRILESLSVRVLNPNLRGQILCLVGPPGVGKSSIAKSIADAIGRKFVRISLGGVRDEADIRGHRKTYLGAMPGRIIEGITQAKVMNPLMLLDEIDKMSNDYRGDPSAALLEVLDSEQNIAFRDHYLEIPFDLSQVMFIATANTLETIPAPLRDRMEIIELSSYTREEKFQIARTHLFDKQRHEHGMTSVQLKIEDGAFYKIIDGYTREAGVRQLERQLATVCRKSARQIAEGTRKRITIKEKDVVSALGNPKYHPDPQSKLDTVGLVNGLAWTSVGGVLMPLEAMILDEGKGSIQITGSLGKVMTESAKLAISYARSVAKEYSIPMDFYKTHDFHIHAPEGAVPKDGPSAGVTMVTALVSALSGIPVRADVAMTGEITLHGRVMPIGGLREKSIAAYRAGISLVIIPEGNIGDLDEIDSIVKEHVQFVPVKTLDEVLRIALACERTCDTYDDSQGRQSIAKRSVKRVLA